MLSNSEIFIVLASFIVLYGYQIAYFFQVKKHPLATSIGFNDRARAIWVKHIQDNKLDILAIQTLRNWTMAATFLASTAIILSLGILNFALTSEGLSEIAHEFNFAGSTEHPILLLKAFLLGIDFIVTFMSFVLAVRFYNHVSFLINIPDNYSLSINAESVISAINQGALCYNIGMRGYYLSIPLIFWLLGPIWMFISALVITFVVYKLDHGV